MVTASPQATGAMGWCKNNPAQVVLALSASVLLLSSLAVLEKALQPAKELAPGELSNPAHLDAASIASPAFEILDSALQEFRNPARCYDNSFFPDDYVIDFMTHKPAWVCLLTFATDSLSSRPIPNKWFYENNLPIPSRSYVRLDSDGDGFFDEDEWRAGTDPNNRKSHPPYATKLFLKEYRATPFPLVLLHWESGPAAGEAAIFQIKDAVHKKNQFAKLGERLADAPYALKSFERKTRINPKTNTEEDRSELTLSNVETEATIVLPLNTVVDSPDSEAVLLYELHKPYQPLKMKRGESFVLEPEQNATYTLLEAQNGSAVIQSNAGEKITVRPDPRLSKTER